MILMYHKIHPDTPSMWWVSVNEFYRQMVELSNKKVVYLDDYDSKNLDNVVITFDGIYKNVLEYALPILKHFNYPFELFLTSDYIGSDNFFDSVEPLTHFTDFEDLIKLVDGGGRLQWHTRSHPNLKTIIDVDFIQNELSIPNEVRNLDKRGFNWFAYPHGEFNEIVLKEVKLRFKGAVSCNQGDNNDRYLYNRLTVENHTRLRNETIACIIPCYNYGAFLIEAIESVIKQTIVPDEILISDDCSTDETQIIAMEYVRKFPKLIKYVKNESNLGIVKHFNKAIKLTRSDYVFFLGADNRLLSNYIEESVKVLDMGENIGVAYTDYTFFGPRAKIAYEALPDIRKAGVKHNVFFKIFFPDAKSRDELLENISKSNIIHGSSMFKRKAFDSVQGYVETDMPEDYNLFKRIILNGWDAKKANKTNFEYRQHSSYQANNMLTLQNQMIFYKKAYISLKDEKSTFENSLFFRRAFKLYNYLNFLKKNYRNPKKIYRKIKSKF